MLGLVKQWTDDAIPPHEIYFRLQSQAKACHALGVRNQDRAMVKRSVAFASTARRMAEKGIVAPEPKGGGGPLV